MGEGCAGLRGCEFLLPTVRSTGFSRNRFRVTDPIPPEGGTTNKKLTAPEANTVSCTVLDHRIAVDAKHRNAILARWVAALNNILHAKPELPVV